ncbi:MAG: hypothetical protein RTV72_01530 [Candidatus Thorarchaeota archaeon]
MSDRDCSTMGPRLSKRQWFVVKWIYPPIGWGVGAVLITWLGVLDMDLLSAFVLGFIVGLVHDIALVAFGVGKWGDIYTDAPPKSSE